MILLRWIQQWLFGKDNKRMSKEKETMVVKVPVDPAINLGQVKNHLENVYPQFEVVVIPNDWDVAFQQPAEPQEIEEKTPEEPPKVLDYFLKVKTIPARSAEGYLEAEFHKDGYQFVSRVDKEESSEEEHLLRCTAWVNAPKVKEKLLDLIEYLVDNKATLHLDDISDVLELLEGKGVTIHHEGNTIL